MAIVEVKVPQLSESVSEATLLQWKKKVGEAVAVDEILIEVETDKVVLEVPAPSAGVLVEIVQADGAPAAAASGGKGDVAMPAAAKLLADNNLKTSDVAGTGKDGRVTKGDVLGAVAAGTKPAAAPQAAAPAPAPKAPLPAVAAPVMQMGDRPEQRVPMSRLRARVAERLLQSQS